MYSLHISSDALLSIKVAPNTGQNSLFVAIASPTAGCIDRIAVQRCI